MVVTELGYELFIHEQINLLKFEIKSLYSTSTLWFRKRYLLVDEKAIRTCDMYREIVLLQIEDSYKRQNCILEYTFLEYKLDAHSS